MEGISEVRVMPGRLEQGKVGQNVKGIESQVKQLDLLL